MHPVHSFLLHPEHVFFGVGLCAVPAHHLRPPPKRLPSPLSSPLSRSAGHARISCMIRTASSILPARVSEKCGLSELSRSIFLSLWLKVPIIPAIFETASRFGAPVPALPAFPAFAAAEFPPAFWKFCRMDAIAPGSIPPPDGCSPPAGGDCSAPPVLMPSDCATWRSCSILLGSPRIELIVEFRSSISIQSLPLSGWLFPHQPFQQHLHLGACDQFFDRGRIVHQIVDLRLLAGGQILHQTIHVAALHLLLELLRIGSHLLAGHLHQRVHLIGGNVKIVAQFDSPPVSFQFIVCYISSRYSQKCDREFALFAPLRSGDWRREKNEDHCDVGYPPRFFRHSGAGAKASGCGNLYPSGGWCE